jgi:two-component system alkaline phosphatase synthesis response regulator PhoP
MSKGIVLAIDDERDLIELVRYNLVSEGYEVIGAGDGEVGLSLAEQEKPDLILLDLMLPGIDGFEVCRALRADTKTAEIPIIMLTAKTSEPDKIVGLEMGADDYITKPFSPRELTARIKALLRRAVKAEVPLAILRQGELSIDLNTHEVCCGGHSIELTATEFRLMKLMASHPGHVYGRSALIDGAIGRDVAVLDRTVDVHIMALRRKLGSCGVWIETMRGFGYKFRETDTRD